MPVEQEREALVEAAVAVFGRRGRRAATVEEIAEAAGVKKASVYAHFSGKDALLAAANAAALDRLGAVMTSAYEGSRHLPAEDRVRARIAGLFDYAESDPDGCELIMSAEREADGEALAGAEQLRDTIITGGAGIIAEELIAAGLPRDEIGDRAVLVATMLLGMVEFTARRMYVHHQWERESVITFLTRFTISGIAGVYPQTPQSTAADGQPDAGGPPPAH